MKNQIKCNAKIHHGPGHQSITRCKLTNRGHKIHEAVYGSFDQYAQWKGLKAFSGYFDEPPLIADTFSKIHKMKVVNIQRIKKKTNISQKSI